MDCSTFIHTFATKFIFTIELKRIFCYGNKPLLTEEQQKVLDMIRSMSHEELNE